MRRVDTVPATVGVDDPRDLAQRFEDAFAAGDVERLVALYTDDAVAVPGPGEVATGPAEIRDMLKGWLAQGRISLKHKALHQVGDTALEILEWTLSGSDPTDPGSGVSATVLRRQPDGRWRMQIDNCFILD